MGKYKAYSEYRESGVEWVGEIPRDWEVGPLKYKVRFITGSTPSTVVENYYSDEVSEYPWIRPEDIVENSDVVHASKHLTELGWNTLRKIPRKSILLCCIGTIGKLSFLPKEATTNQQITAVIPSKSQKYYFYVLTAARAELEQMATGNVVKILNIERLSKLKIPFLNSELAERISNYLDYETTKIDTLIGKQERLIELLREKRQAVISHAVTKGLDASVPMKDSGVEWLGEVPEHWIVGRLKNALRIRNGRDYKHIEVDVGGYPIYGSGGIFKRGSDYLYDGKSVLYGRKGTVDKPLLVEGRFWTLDTMFYSEVFEKVLPEYAYYQSTLFPFGLLSTNTALPSMTQEDLLELGFVLPDKEEQKSICKEISRQLNVIDDLVEACNKQLALLKERRTALISAAVTGKIDVREVELS